LGVARWQAEYSQGGSLDKEAALALALEETPPAAQRQTDGGTLTRRQREVAQLVAQGLTDREVAARLSISIRTAESHVEQILARLGFRSRAQVAAWAATNREAQADDQIEHRR
jgi:DNA-binding NarL/FixJ family response regulator